MFLGRVIALLVLSHLLFGYASFVEASEGGGLPHFESSVIGSPVKGMPWISDLTIADLDGDGRLDVIACEGKLNHVLWLRQGEDGTFSETVLSRKIAGPAHVEAVDVDGDDDLDLLVAAMGIVTPNDQRIGSLLILENLGNGSFNERTILKDVWRISDVRAGDLDGDGDFDLAIGQFGYFQGAVQWLENKGDWEFEPHPLSDLAGTVHAPIGDLNGDGHLDILALISQDWEELHAFVNDGAGNFETRMLHGSTNRDFGSSGLALADLDQDGDLDAVYTNGDGFDYATPGSRPWHGLQWLENKGELKFEYHRIGDQPGGYSPTVIDIDGDGDLDILVAVWFNDWRKADSASLVCFENDGDQNFERKVLARAPTHLVALDAADIDGDGRIELVSGAFHFYPPYDRLSRISLWRQEDE